MRGRPAFVPGAYCPAANAMLSPDLNARDWSASFARAACSVVCTRTRLKSAPKRDSMNPRVVASSG